jgi:hypothetical protein
MIKIKAINSEPNNEKEIPVKIKVNIKHNIDIIVFLENTTQKLKKISISIIINNIKFYILIF